MKKVIFSMLALFCAAFAFTSCEDVPMPYDQPGEGGEEPVIIQPTGEGTADNPFNVAAALEYVNNLAADEKSEGNIYIKGKVSSINTNYDESGTFGNAVFYISDDGTGKNTFYVYRALYLGNKKYSSGETLNEGDEVIICGKVVNYKGTTPETVQSEAFLYSLNGKTAGGGGDTPSGDAKGSGTLSDPYNPLGATNAVKNLTWTDNTTYDTTGEVYVKGKISRIADKGTFTDGGTYGNASFYISEDGTENGEFYCFRVLYLGNKKFAAGQTDIKVGDEVIVCGQLMNYRGNTPETVAGKAYLYSLNGKTEGGGGETPSGDAKGSGTLSDPYNPLGATNAVKNLTWTDNTTYDTTGEVYVKGKISRIADKGTFTDGGTYGNASFYISEDGTENGEFYCFRVLYLGNKKFAAGQTDIKVGDEVIVCGQLMNYRGNTPETVAGKAYLYSLNGKTEGGGGGGETPAGNVTKTVDGAVVTLVVAGATEGNKVTVDLSAQGWESGKAVDPATITLSDGTKITFAKGEGSNTPAFYSATKGVRVYAKNTITISGKAVAKVVMTCDSYNGTAYTGNSTLYASASGTTFTICNEHSEAKGGDQLRVQTIEITYAK